MASKDAARRGPRPSADPLHIAKRKLLIAEEFARDGTHSNIRKSISWGDLGRNGTGSPNKRARTSLSESLTPGLSDMSTPTPINRPRPALKPSSSQKSTMAPPRRRPSTQSGRASIGQPASILKHSQQDFTFRAPHPPTPQRPQSQPEVINLISEETPQSDKGPKPPNSGDQVAREPGPSRRATESQQVVDPPPPASPTSEAGTQYREEDIFDDAQATSHVPLPRPNSDRPASQKPPTDDSSLQTTNVKSSVHSASPSRRKRRTSEIGIQTIPDRDVDWLDDLGRDNSMSAVEISRVWAEKRSGSKPGEADPHEQPEPDEPLTGNFLDEFEGRSVNDEEAGSEYLDNAGNLEQTNQVQEDHGDSNEQDVEDQAVDQDDVPTHAPSSSRASSPANLVHPSQSDKFAANAVIHPAPSSSPLRFPSSPPREGIASGSQSSVRPYPFNLSQRKPANAATRPLKDAQTDAQPRPISSSQPNPFREGSRLYTPQPVPPSRNKTLNELRAAPTLGRSTLGDTQPTPAKSANSTDSRAEPSTTPGSQAKSLKAAPTLGRSTDWGHVSPARPAATATNERDGSNSGHQPTDYDAEYGSVPEAPSSRPSQPPSSPAQYAWEVEPAHSSTPNQFVTQLSSTARDVAQNKSPNTISVPQSSQASTLVALEKRRRSSIAPLAESKKIRREFDTVESNAVPNPRAHEDTYDESGRRSWVPKRPNMKRALDAPSAKAVSRPAPVAEESEPAEVGRSQVVPESALESRAETFEPVPYGETMQEHQVELDGQSGRVLDSEVGHRPGHPSTEIAETPQSTRVRNLYDLTTSDLQSQRFTSELSEHIANPKSIDYAYVSLASQPGARIVREHELPTIDAPQEDEPALTPVAEQIASGSQLKSSQRSRIDGRPTKKAPKSRRQSSGLHITPARQSVWSPPRTRLSLGGRSGVSVLEVSKSDQDILVQAGLRPILKRLSQAHGFTVDVVAEVYQEMGSLKETEDALDKMKHSAERTRVSISRRRSTLGAVSGEARNLAERDDGSESSGANNDYLNWDTSRMSNRILFGEGL